LQYPEQVFKGKDILWCLTPHDENTFAVKEVSNQKKDNKSYVKSAVQERSICCYFAYRFQEELLAKNLIKSQNALQYV